MKIKVNMSRERHKDKWWDGEYAGSIEREGLAVGKQNKREDRPLGKPKANGRRLRQTKIGLDLEYDIDEI